MGLKEGYLASPQSYFFLSIFNALSPTRQACTAHLKFRNILFRILLRESVSDELLLAGLGGGALLQGLEVGAELDGRQS